MQGQSTRLYLPAGSLVIAIDHLELETSYPQTVPESVAPGEVGASNDPRDSTVSGAKWSF